MRYEAAVLVGMLLLASVSRLAAQSQRSLNMNETITVSLRSSDRPSLLYGPVPVTVTVRNVSAAPLSILLAYPIPEGLRFQSRNPEVAVLKPAAAGIMTRTAWIDIASG